MKIVIIGAMEEEIALLKSKLTNLSSEQLAHLDVFTGQLHQHDVFLVQSGIGKVAASCATTLVIQAYKPDYVINTGSAGGFDPELNIGDIVIANALLHHDVNVTHFGYQLGQVPQMPASFESDTKLVNTAQTACNILQGIQVKTGKIATGDSFIGSDEAALEIRSKFSDLAAVEMEGAAIAQTAYMMSTPFLIIRSLSDIASKESTMSFENYLKLAAKNSANLVIEILAKLS